MKKRSNFNKLLICSLVLLLSGCASFDEKFDPEQAKWSQKVGDKTVTVRGYYITAHDKSETRCDADAGEAVLMPDTPYFRDLLRILGMTLAFKSSPSHKAQQFIRWSSWHENCIYNFTKVPPGNWLIIINIDPRREHGCTVSSGCGINVIPYYLYVPLVVKPEDTIVKKNAVLDYSNIGFFSLARQMQAGELHDWTEPMAQIKHRYR